MPTVSETVLPGYEVTGGLGIGGPRDTPAEIIDKLNVAIKAGLNDDVVKSHLVELRQHPDSDEPRRLSQADRRRERQVEQGDQVRRGIKTEAQERAKLHPLP